MVWHLAPSVSLAVLHCFYRAQHKRTSEHLLSPSPEPAPSQALGSLLWSSHQLLFRFVPENMAVVPSSWRSPMVVAGEGLPRFSS